MILIAVFSSLLAAGMTFLWGAYKTIIMILHFVTAIGGEAYKLRVETIAIMDIFIIATALLIFALGLYELFIAKLDLPEWLTFNNLDELKNSLRRVIIFIMAVTFLEKLVLWENPKSTLMFGIAIALITAVLIAFEKFSGNNNGNGV